MQMDPDDIIEDASVVKKGGKPRKPPKDDRDKLLYQVTEISPPPTKLGLFKLDPNAGCGDCIEVPTDEDGSSSVFVIKKVSYKYAHRGGRMQMIGKDADVKEAARDSLEKFMTRMLPSLSGDDDGAVGDAADESDLQSEGGFDTFSSGASEAGGGGYGHSVVGAYSSYAPSEACDDDEASEWRGRR